MCRFGDVDLVVPPTLARLSFQVPPERRAAFEAGYAGKIAPLLQRHGMAIYDAGEVVRRDTVFSRFFALPSPADVMAKQVELETDPAWREALREFGGDLEAIGPEGTVPVDFHLYAAPSGSGRTVRGGSGVVQKGKGFSVKAGVGQRQGAWLNLGVSEGLSNPTVLAVLQDRKGYLWVGTQGGVSRYDGQTWTTFTTEDGLANNAVSVIVEDRQGNLWFGTGGRMLMWGGWTLGKGSGVSRYDGQTWTTFTAADGLASNTVHAIAEDRQGNLWFGTEGGVSRYDGERFVTFTVADGLAHNAVHAIAEDRAGNIWLATRGGLQWYDGERFSTLAAGDDSTLARVVSIMEDRQGNLWFGSNRYYFKDGLWIFGGTGGGLSRYDGDQVTTFTLGEGAMQNSIFGLLEDRTGLLWIGTGSGSVGKVTRYDGERFTAFPAKDIIIGLLARSMVEDREGNIWFATPYGVQRYDGKEFVAFTTEDSLADNNVFDVLEDREGNMWFSTVNGGVQVGMLSALGLAALLIVGQGTRLVRRDRRLEAQNRELVIGQAVERVRAEASAMRESRDIVNLIRAFWQGLRDIRLDFDTINIQVVDEAADVLRLNGALTDEFLQAVGGAIPEDRVQRDLLEGVHLATTEVPLEFARERGWAMPGIEASIFITPEQLLEDLRQVWKGESWPDSWVGMYTLNVPFAYGGLFITAGPGIEYTDADLQTVLQFADAVSLGYTRFLDLRATEKRNRELILERAVERVRAEALSMRRRDDMVKVVAVMWQELKALDVETGQVCISFVDEPGDRIVDYAAMENPRKRGIPAWIGMVEIDDDTAVFTGESRISLRSDDYMERWRAGEPWSFDVTREIAETFGYENTNVLTTADSLSEKWNLTLVPFTYGSVSLATLAFQEENVPVVQAFTEALSLGYIRYLDFQRLEEARLAADAANQAKSAFLANMSHELRTPLNSVIAMSDILLEKYFGPLTEDQEGYVRDVRDSGQHLLALINDILDLSKIEAGYSPLELARVDLKGLLENSLTIVRERAHNHGIELACELAEDLPEVVADERKVRQVVFNLLSNAVKFTPDGGRVGIAAEREGEEGVRVCVWDTGIGIAAENHEKVFRVFEQAESAPDKQYEGAGLGLALVKRFVEQHGGRVWLESAPGEGSRFYFTLPLQAVDARAAESAQT